MDYCDIYDQVESLKDYKQVQMLHALCDMKLCEMKGMYNTCVTGPEDVNDKLSFLKFEETEKFVAVSLNAVNEVIAIHEITKGLVNQVPIHPREAFVETIKDRAVAVVFAHNHPSGGLEPSLEDMAMTRTLCAAGRILQIPVLDHVIISYRGFTSICRKDPTIFERTFPDQGSFKTN